MIICCFIMLASWVSDLVLRCAPDLLAETASIDMHETKVPNRKPPAAHYYQVCLIFSTSHDRKIPYIFSLRSYLPVSSYNRIDRNDLLPQKSIKQPPAGNLSHDRRRRESRSPYSMQYRSMVPIRRKRDPIKTLEKNIYLSR